MIRQCVDSDFAVMEAVINEAAEAYRGAIPADRWHEPYMSSDELKNEIAAGVKFWGWEESGALVGIMGLQDVRDVTLIRHAYVRTTQQGRGVGGRLLQYLIEKATKPLLVGTWAAAEWAIRFYQRHGFRLLTPEEKDQLLSKYWNIPARQKETSVVLEFVRNARPS